MIIIRHARLDEKKKTYEWLCLSDTAQMHMGEPDYPESPVPDWNMFQEDFEDFYYREESQNLGSVMLIEKDSVEIGCLCYACFHLQPRIAELDVWLNSRKYCGKGYGTIALEMLVDYLRESKMIKKFIIRPSVKNIRAIKAYEKVGFRRVNQKEYTIKKYLREEYVAKFGDGDYGFEDTLILTLEL